MGPSPLLEFFKRGEVARDVRLLAAQGAIAPRAHEQLGILVILLEDQDREIRQTASDTLDRIPVEALKGFLARPDVPVGLREFFADRGVFPEQTPPIEIDDPLVEIEPDTADALHEDADGDRDSILQKLATM